MPEKALPWMRLLRGGPDRVALVGKLCCATAISPQQRARSVALAGLQAAKRWRERRDGANGDPVFGLSGRQVGRCVAAAARGAGLGEGFSGHSGRVGLAAELSRGGTSTHEVAVAVGWKSAGMVIRGTRRETAKRGAVAKYFKDRENPPG